MTKADRSKLIALGVEALADVLLELSLANPDVDDRIKRLLATPEQNVKRYKDKLASLKRSRSFISWREAGAFVDQLEHMLNDLDAGICDPWVGVELVGKFFEADAAIFNRCDDSSGNIGNVFRFTAANQFVSFASRCEHKEKIADLVIKLNRQDDYGLRDCLFARASEYLPVGVMRAMIQQLWILSEQAADTSPMRHWNFAIQSLAKQLNDAPLFENAKRAFGETSVAGWIEIAQVYFKAGDPQMALSRLENISTTESYMLSERLHLLVEIHHQLGNLKEETEYAWIIFKTYHSVDSLERLLAVIGAEQRDNVINDEIRVISQKPTLSYADASFMLSVERIDELEHYLLQRIDQLDGNLYSTLVKYAEAFEQRDKLVMSSLIYRALVDSILARALSKYYHHAVKYLKKLDNIALRITDWQTVLSHADYLELLREQHKRKSAFWSKY